MGTLDKEIRVIAVKGARGQDGQDGADGKSSYELAIENELFSGTLEEWINTFATPENYITRGEFQKVTQAQYDALKQAGELIPNCYYLIIDSTDAEDFEQAQEDISNLKDDVSNLDDDVNDPTTGLKTKVATNETNIGLLQKILKNEQIFTNEEYEVEVTNDGETLQIKGNQVLTNDDTRNTVTLLLNYDEFSVTFETWNEGAKTNDVSFKVEPDGEIRFSDSTNETQLTPEILNELKNRHLYRHDMEFYTGTEKAVYFSLYLSTNEVLTNVTLANYISANINITATGFYKSTPNADPVSIISLYKNGTNWYIRTLNNITISISNTTSVDSTFSDNVNDIY